MIDHFVMMLSEYGKIIHSFVIRSIKEEKGKRNHIVSSIQKLDFLSLTSFLQNTSISACRDIRHSGKKREFSIWDIMPTEPLYCNRHHQYEKKEKRKRPEVKNLQYPVAKFDKKNIEDRRPR